MPVYVSEGMNYYKQSSWDVGEDITACRPPKDVYEVFVGIDSEFVRESVSLTRGGLIPRLGEFKTC